MFSSLQYCCSYALVAGVTILSAQATPIIQPDTLTLESAVLRGERKSPAAAIALQRARSNKLLNEAFFARLLPQVTFTADLPNLERGINRVTQPDGSVLFVPQSQTFSTGGLTLRQSIPLTGGEITIGSSLNRIDLFGDRNTFSWQSEPFLFSLRQPLFQLNRLAWEQDRQELRFTIAEKEYAEQVQDAAVNAAESFFQTLLAQMDVQAARRNVAVNDTLFQLSKGRFEVGRIAENDLLQSELALMNARAQERSSELIYTQALQNLRITLGYPRDYELHLLPPADIPSLQIDPDSAVTNARKYRSIFTAISLQKRDAEVNIQQARDNNGFRATLNASFGYNQSAKVLSNAYTDLLDRQRASLSLEIPIMQWGAGSAEIEAAVADQQRIAMETSLQEQLAEQEVRFQAENVKQLTEQTVLVQKAADIATRRFEVAKQRYLIGKISINELFMAQNEQETARQQYIATLRSYWTAYFRLRRMTLYDFVAQKPLITE